MASRNQKQAVAEQQETITILKTRFEKNPARHKEIKWEDVQQRLAKQPEKLAVLEEMESTGGEPDVIGKDAATGEIIFCDCSPESPAGRRSFCYDREGWESRKEARPANNAIDMAAEMGVALLTEDEYRDLQKHGPFDTKTSSWLRTPDDVRDKGGSLFGDYRYGRVFIYHNGAQSYYAARGFRGLLRV